MLWALKRSVPKHVLKMKGKKNIHNFSFKIFVYLDKVTFFLSITFNVCCGYSKELSQLGVQKNHLIDSVLLSTHNIYFG